jgi:hypothetical protein
VRWLRKSTPSDLSDSVVCHPSVDGQSTVTSIVSQVHYADTPSHLALLGHLVDWHQWRQSATRATRRYDPHRKASWDFQPGILRRSNHPLFHHVSIICSSPSRLQVSLSPSLPSTASASLVRSPNFHFPPCDHSMPVIMVWDACRP